MNLILASKAKQEFAEVIGTDKDGKPIKVDMDYRTFDTIVKQYKLTQHPVGKRIKYDQDEITRKLKIQPRSK